MFNNKITAANATEFSVNFWHFDNGKQEAQKACDA